MDFSWHKDIHSSIGVVRHNQLLIARYNQMFLIVSILAWYVASNGASANGSVAADIFAQKEIILDASPIDVTISENTAGDGKKLLLSTSTGDSYIYAGEADSTGTTHRHSYTPSSTHLRAIQVKVTFALQGGKVYTDGDYYLPLSAASVAPANQSTVLPVRISDEKTNAELPAADNGFVGSSETLNIKFTITDGALATSVARFWLSVDGLENVDQTSATITADSFTFGTIAGPNPVTPPNTNVVVSSNA